MLQEAYSRIDVAAEVYIALRTAQGRLAQVCVPMRFRIHE